MRKRRAESYSVRVNRSAPRVSNAYGSPLKCRNEGTGHIAVGGSAVASVDVRVGAYAGVVRTGTKEAATNGFTTNTVCVCTCAGTVRLHTAGAVIFRAEAHKARTPGSATVAVYAIAAGFAAVTNIGAIAQTKTGTAVTHTVGRQVCDG